MLRILDIIQEGSESSSLPLQKDYWLGKLDTRWLAIFRILFGLIMLKDAIYHIFLANLFYSDTGLVPRSALFAGLARQMRFSLMDSIGSAEFAIAFFLLWILVLIALIVGYRVRLMSVLNFIILLSVHERNVYILTGADTLMRVMAFWIMFAPIGQHYALDSLRRKQLGYEPESRSFALPLRILQWQFVIVYICTAYLKTIGPIWTNGEVLHYVLQLDSFITPVAEWMRSWPPELLKFFSFGALFMEVLIPFLLVFPLFWRWARLLAFLLAIALHGGIAVMMSIPDFSILMLVCYVLFFDPTWLEWLERRFSNQVQIIEAKLGQFNNYAYPEFWRPMSNLPYGKRTMSFGLLFIFALVIWWNVFQTSQYNDESYVETSYPYPISYPPEPFESSLQRGEDLLRLIGLWQFWDMFSPLPIQHDGWFLVRGEFENGEFRDLLSGLPPEEVSINRWYWGPDMRWEKWEENVYAYSNEKLMASWSAYYCRLYENNLVGERLARIELHYNRTNLHAPDTAPNEPIDDVVWYHWCFPEYAPQG